jgi:exodeoxyribonuclease V gamma subunit
MALHLHRADRTDLLADGLGRLLANPLADPFAEELVLVSARGMATVWQSSRRRCAGWGGCAGGG